MLYSFKAGEYGKELPATLFEDAHGGFDIFSIDAFFQAVHFPFETVKRGTAGDHAQAGA